MKDRPLDQWEPVIGLEIHVQLNTRSKLFSSAPNRFGDSPNTNISPVCTGQPGALPVLNKEAVWKAVQFGLAVNATVNLISRFDRKSYFYPDSPRNFQITQFEKPILTGGSLKTSFEGEEKVFRINRAHLEDDAGILKHFSTFAGIDYNRAGAPLIEIVSEPCMHTAKEASSYASAIRTIMLYLNASDCNMEEGTLRIDANVSVRKKGEKGFRPKVEIKNMNSFTFMELAIDREFRRQVELYLQYPDRVQEELIPPGTYRWDHDRKEIVLMRKKETSDDYRYFPEPDLSPIVLTDEFVDRVRHSLPELPQDRFQRYLTDLGLSRYAASVLIQDKPLSDYFEEALKTSSNPQLLCNWIIGEFSGRLKDTGKTLRSLGIVAAHISKLVRMIDENKITGRIAKSVADEMLQNPGLDPEKIVEKNPDYKPISNESELEPLVHQVLLENPQSLVDFKAGKDKAFAFLVGQVMKLTRGKASPKVVNELLKKMIS